jgi:hypothetical protein
MGEFRMRFGEGLRLSLRLSMIAAVGLVCAFTGARSSAQTPVAPPVAKTMLTEPPVPLLPATLGKLTRVAQGDSGDGLGSLDAADAPVLTEDGLKRFAQSEYAAANGSAQGTIAAYRFADASGAISAYDYFRKPGMRPEKVGDDAVSSGDELLMRSGVNVVVGHFKLDHDAMLALTKELSGHLPIVNGPAAMAPMVPALLPAKGLDADSVKYALGPAGYQAMGGVLPVGVVGFDKSAETATAKYKNGGMLTLMLYPTPEIAGEHLREVEAAMRGQVAASDQAKSAAGTVMMRREGPLVILTTGAWKAADAQKMLDGIHLHSEVSFDKPMPPEFHAEVQKTYSLLTSIAVFCGVGAAAAVFLGLFLGGGRAMIRVMMGKSAASEPEFLRIDLRGGGGKNLRNPEG